ncbi:glycine-rich cell wall structural protein 2-like [Phragmites australis]|uniref:glycine-rich cell wall structural protein 2-like n=1 Tax=Phragmites australis TaxID=29695 RepID=UPI002D78194B|nr:glycine-rich cell wall structural protein 2-like [Phragmites australis]
MPMPLHLPMRKGRGGAAAGAGVGRQTRGGGWAGRPARRGGDWAGGLRPGWGAGKVDIGRRSSVEAGQKGWQLGGRPDTWVGSREVGGVGRPELNGSVGMGSSSAGLNGFWVI